MESSLDLENPKTELLCEQSPHPGDAAKGNGVTKRRLPTEVQGMQSCYLWQQPVELQDVGSSERSQAEREECQKPCPHVGTNTGSLQAGVSTAVTPRAWRGLEGGRGTNSSLTLHRAQGSDVSNVEHQPHLYL